MPGEGAGSYFQYGYELSDGVPGPLTSSLPFMSESFKEKPTMKPNPNNNARGTASKRRLTKLEIDGAISGAPDSESQARLRAHHRGFVTTTVLDAPNNVHQHVLRDLLRTDAAPATYRKTINGVIFRDITRAKRLDGGKVETVKVGINEYDYVDMSHDIMWGNRSNIGDPVSVAVNAAYTGALKSRGTHRAPANTTDEIYVRVTTGGALDGTALIKVKQNLAAAYGSATYAVVANQWITIEDEAGLALGPHRNNPIQILFTSGGVLTALDEFKIPLRRTIVAPTYTTRDVFQAADLFATIGGAEIPITHKFELTGTHPRKPRGGTGTIFNYGVNDAGMIEWTLDIERDYTDEAFLDALDAGSIVDVTLRLRGDRIGASAFREEHSFRMRAMQYANAGGQVSGGGQQSEKISLLAYDPVTNPICEETLINTIPAL